MLTKKWPTWYVRGLIDDKFLITLSGPDQPDGNGAQQAQQAKIPMEGVVSRDRSTPNRNCVYHIHHTERQRSHLYGKHCLCFRTGQSGISLLLLCGSCIQAGISQHVAFALGFGNSALQLCMNFVNFALIYYLGRRTIMLMGFTLMDTTLIIIGVVAVLGDKGNTDARWAQPGLQLVSRFSGLSVNVKS
jgi:hypothetical protein